MPNWLKNQENRSMSKKILFMCPHHAAKSVLAATYGRQLVQERGLDWQVDSAGTEPAAAVSPAVANLLAGEGFDVSAHHPRRVTPAEITEADHIISMGCDLSGLAPAGANITHWDDVPATSENLTVARNLIYDRVQRFIDELA
jgi:arsenate reductase (thioredoxin)